MAVFLAMMVMPFSRSRSIESMTRSANLLVAAEGAALPEHRVDQGRLAVVDVGDDRQISKVFSLHLRHRSPARRALNSRIECS